MKFADLMISVLFYAALCAVLSLVFTVALLGLPAEHVRRWAIVAAIFGGIGGALLDRKRTQSIWIIILDGVLAAF